MSSSAMDLQWRQIAGRIVEALGVHPGELIQVRDGSDRYEVFQEVMLATELAGATPLAEMLPAAYLQRLWNDAPLDYLASWDQHRATWMQQYDRVLRLVGAEPDMSQVRSEGFETWLQAVHRLTVTEEGRRLPFLVAAIPTAQRAQQMGWTLERLEAHLLPALAASVDELRRAIAPVLNALRGGQVLTIRSGKDHVLTLHHGNRRWHDDDGILNMEDRTHGAFVGNLPSGDIYTTVLESGTEGTLWLAQADAASDVVFYFEQGRIEAVEAGSGADTLNAMFARHMGEPRRVSHIGIGLNPYLHEPIGWTLVDEHIHGQMYIALGENRYMGGENESSLNVDFAIPQATFLADGRVIVEEGKVAV